MFLKRVTACGFKSFCDKVDFDFTSGVTCIVGPNGCGKSNVVDAFKWVLGEQSARSLRGRQMIDMIFNGSSSRKSSSVAQVDLMFENTDRSLAMDCDEVTVSRKLYRSGESEYLLNGTPARLKDVRELFMDTGVGVGAYSVIEQGRVDQLLQSSPAERRVIFEEAAGISKYKARKREAERKLERTQQNLFRVADVIEELERRLRSVKTQATKARNFKEYEARLNELRSTYAMAEYHRFAQEQTSLTRAVDAANDRATGHRAGIGAHERKQSEIALRLDELAEQIGTADNELVKAQSDQAAMEERIEAAGVRERELLAQLESARSRVATSESRRDECQGELDKLQATAHELQRETHELHARIDALNEQDRELARDVTQAQAIVEDEKAGILELVRRSAQTHNDIVRLNSHQESLLGQKSRLSERDASLRNELEAALSQRAQLEERVAEVEQIIQEETARLEEKKAEATRVDAARQSLVDQLAEVKERRSGVQSRLELLSDLQRKMDGVGEGTRRLLDRAMASSDSAADRNIVGLVADVFEVDVPHARVIEAALGVRDQYLVARSRERFLAGEALREDLPGSVTAVCLDALPPIINERDFCEHEGFVARLIDLVRFDDEFERIARHLLGKTIVVDSLDAALRMSLEDVSGHRFVTTSGEVIDADGRVTVGPPTSAAGLISRRSELRELGEEISRIDGEIERLGDLLNRTQAEASHLGLVQQNLRTAIYESSTAKVEASAALQTIRETVGRLTAEQPLIAQEVAMIEEGIREVLEKRSKSDEALRVLDEENKAREQRVEGLQQRADSLAEKRREVQGELTEARVRAGELKEKRTATAESINAARRTLHELEHSISQTRTDIEQFELRLAETRDAAQNGKTRLTELASLIEEVADTCAKLRGERDTLRLETDGLSKAIRSERGALEEAEAEVHRKQMELAQLGVRRDELVQRTRDDLDIDLIDRYDNYEHEEQDWAAVEIEIAELRKKIDRLGNVNLDALDELAELEERYTFLTSQRDDLDESRRQLEQLIQKLNAESEERFRETFREVRDNFRTLFRKLFGGGKADIILEDDADVLECGIEIVAQPPGKELRSISLMSGGEKSMTAIALLMSIFKSKPAPFAILDEVDAALDEANNDRFNRIIQEFVSTSQFIIITHSKRTMGIGDQLYGVTMQEPGVSTRVSVQLKDAERVA